MQERDMSTNVRDPLEWNWYIAGVENGYNLVMSNWSNAVCLPCNVLMCHAPISFCVEYDSRAFAFMQGIVYSKYYRAQIPKWNSKGALSWC